jgi:hypothetical protein
VTHPAPVGNPAPEPGPQFGQYRDRHLEPLLRKNIDAGRLRFTNSWAEVGEFGEVHFLCVGTPQGKAGNADLRYLHAATDAHAAHLNSDCLIVGKSTVPVGTARELLARARAAAPAGDRVDLAWNPEFLREGHAVQDCLTPDRFVFGVTSDAAATLLRRVYARPLDAGIPALQMDLETVELVKVAANSFLATKISFINVMAEMCEAVGADVTQRPSGARPGGPSWRWASRHEGSRPPPVPAGADGRGGRADRHWPGRGLQRLRQPKHPGHAGSNRPWPGNRGADAGTSAA